MKSFQASFCLLLALATLTPHSASAQNGTFTLLHGFMHGYIAGSDGDGYEGGAGVVLSGDMLYGTASTGGTNNQGLVFKIATDGAGYTALHYFNDGDGAMPYGGGLALSSGILYGATQGGGNYGGGTIFRIRADGTGFTNLYHFTAPAGAALTNREGAWPNCELTLSGDTLYGSAGYGGSAGQGTIFKITTNGTGFTVLHVFSGNDGTRPTPGLVLSGRSLYGAAYSGGGYGTIFKVNTDGTDFAVLHAFNDQLDNDGMFPGART